MPSARPGAAESISHAHVLVRTVTGLERLAAAELTAAGHRVIDLSARQLVVEPAADTIVTAPPRLADDLFLIAATAPDPGRHKADLDRLRHSLRDLRIPLPHKKNEPFAVSASCAGSRTYTRFDVEDVIGAVVAARTGARYHSRRAGTPPKSRRDWRATLDGTTAHVAVRPFGTPLHRRAWRHHTVVGSLHPPVAAAMAKLADVEPGHQVLDPFCGAGTTLIEASGVEPDAIYLGTDHDPKAVAAARANAPGIRWRVSDARAHTGFDRIITNPPWDVRLSIGDLAPHVAHWRRALRPSGLAVVIVGEHQVAAVTRAPGWRVVAVHELAVGGQHPRIVVLRPTG